MSSPTTFAIVGSGWRSEFFVRLARLLPEELTLVAGVVRRPEAAEEVAGRWSVPTYLSVDEMVSAQHPAFVVTSVPRAVNPEIVAALVASGTHVLSETPPATDLDGMRRLWSEVGGSGLVQVAEQYLLLPGHATRLALVRRGVIGQCSSVQVSSTHDYHAVSIMRGYLGLLGAEQGPVRVQAARYEAPTVDPLGRDGWTDDPDVKDTGTLLGLIDFGDGRSGLYDFTDNQWHNQLRARRVIIRGSHGEIQNDTVLRLAGARSIVASGIARRQLGYDLDLGGYDTEHLSWNGEVVWRNPLLGLRLMDEEIAIGTMLVANAAWARDEGPAPYPLADACQDHHVALAVHEAARTATAVTAAVEPWARELRR
jgi:predicted dehydrogenase